MNSLKTVKIFPYKQMNNANNPIIIPIQFLFNFYFILDGLDKSLNFEFIKINF